MKMVQRSEDQLFLLLLSHADEEHAQSALIKAVEPASLDVLSLQADAMRRWLNSRYKGILEVRMTGKGIEEVEREQKVQYLHRTVKEYLESREARKMLDDTLSTDFDPHLAICINSLVYIIQNEIQRSCESKVPGRSALLPADDNEFCHHVALYFDNASRTNRSNLVAAAVLVDDLDRIGNLIIKRDSFFVLDSDPNSKEILDSYGRKNPQGSLISSL